MSRSRLRTKTQTRANDFWYSPSQHPGVTSSTAIPKRDDFELSPNRSSPNFPYLLPTFHKMEVLNSAPTESQFTPLSTHQSQTPSSFYSGPPVLYHRSPSTTILINSHELESAPAFQKLVSPQQRSNGSAHPATEDESEDLGHEITIRGVDIWVTSEYEPPSTCSLPVKH